MTLIARNVPFKAVVTPAIWASSYHMLFVRGVETVVWWERRFCFTFRAGDPDGLNIGDSVRDVCLRHEFSLFVFLSHESHKKYGTTRVNNRD